MYEFPVIKKSRQTAAKYIANAQCTKTTRSLKQPAPSRFSGSGFVMAGANEPQFQGLSKYFNTVTQTGRANIAKATYLVIGTIGLFYWSKKKSSGGSAK